MIIDPLGVDPNGGKMAYDLAKEIVSSGGTVMLLNNYDEFRNNCSSTSNMKFSIFE
jgi:hypothetical protein